MLILDKGLAEEWSMVPQSVSAFSLGTCWPEGWAAYLPFFAEQCMDEYCPMLKERCCKKKVNEWCKTAHFCIVLNDNEEIIWTEIVDWVLISCLLHSHVSNLILQSGMYLFYRNQSIFKLILVRFLFYWMIKFLERRIRMTYQGELNEE